MTSGLMTSGLMTSGLMTSGLMISRYDTSCCVTAGSAGHGRTHFGQPTSTPFGDRRLRCRRSGLFLQQRQGGGDRRFALEDIAGT